MMGCRIAGSVLLTFIVTVALSPSVYAQPSLQAGAGLGYALPAGDLGGSTLDYYAGSKYGLSGGINVHGKGRVTCGTWGLALEIGYSSLSNSGDAEAGRGKVDVSQKIFSAKLGPEVHFSLPAIPVAPYLGANVVISSLSGTVDFNGVARVPSASYSVKSAMRTGVGFSGGAVVTLNSLLSLDVAVSYDLVNLFGREWVDVNPDKDQRLDTYLALNDEKDPVALNGTEHVVGAARSIQLIQIKATLLIGL